MTRFLVSVLSSNVDDDDEDDDDEEDDEEDIELIADNRLFKGAEEKEEGVGEVDLFGEVCWAFSRQWTQL